MIRDMLQKQPSYRNKKLRDSARGRPCTLQIPGVCNNDWSTTVLAHSPFGPNGGKGYKVDDFDACFACSACHDVLDGRVQAPDVTERVRLGHFYLGMIRTLQYLFAEGILK